MIKDPTFEELSYVKNEISTFKEEYLSDYREHNKNYIVYLLKKIVFIKYIIRNNTDDYRLYALLSDFIHLIDCIMKGNRRYFYLNTRSIIEHFLRLINNIDTEDTIPNYDVIEKTKSLVKSKGYTDVNLDLVIDVYSESSSYIHGNIKSNLSLAQNFADISTENFGNLDNSLKRVCNLLDELMELFFNSHSELIDFSFHRRKTILLYLTNQKLKKILTEKVS